MADPRFSPGNTPLPRTGTANVASTSPTIGQATVTTAAANQRAQTTQARTTTQAKVNQGWVNFGSDRLNINTTTAKGLEKALGVIAKFIIKVQGDINKVLYGKNGGRQDTNLIKRLLDRGILNLLTDVASVDFCNILNYALNQVGDGQKFDPTKPPPENDVIARKKWQLQKKAYDTQQFIDTYYRDYADNNNPQSKVGLFILIQQIKGSLESTLLSPTEGINDPQLTSNFPQLGLANNFFQNGFGILNRYTDVRQINNEDVQRLISLIDNIRQYCIIIQGLNNPKNAIGLIDSSLNGAIQKELADISKLIINPAVATRVLRDILRVANNINTIGQKILGYITTLQVIVKIGILLIRIFNIVTAFILALPAPAMFLTSGVITTFSDTVQTKLKEKGTKKLLERLEQISFIINLIAIVVTSLLIAIQNIILKLRVILVNLENCSNVDPDLVNDLQNTIKNLSNTGDKLQSFLDQYNNQQQQSQSRFGQYTIQIVTEEVVDEGINLKRRYGIAKDSNGYLVVQSTPTFASLDLIIINEVKALLVSKGLVSSNIASLTAEEEVIVLDAAQILGDDEIDIANINVTQEDVETVAEQDEELGLSSFINNLPGGKALRRRMRRKMIESARKLGTTLKATDPQGKYSSGIIKQQSNEANKLEIEDLQDKIKTWQKEIAVAATQGPFGAVIVRDRVKKIQAAEKRIKELQKG
jgi:hypothetical protein